jgi:hypothetical protein
MSDLVLVFTDLFEADPQLASDSINHIKDYQDSNKFIYVIDHSEISLDPVKTMEIITSWQRRLAELGLNTGQFIVLSNNGDLSMIEQRINNINNARSYRVLESLEKSIRDIDDVVIKEVNNVIDIWKDRCNASTLIILGFVVTLILFAEIAVGILDLFFDPIIGPIVVAGLIAVLTPIHLLISKLHAKFMINDLNERQKKLNIPENLSGLFEQNLTFWRTLMPIRESVAKNKKTRTKLAGLIEQTKNLVQVLNDQFSQYHSDNYTTHIYNAQDSDKNQSY